MTLGGLIYLMYTWQEGNNLLWPIIVTFIGLIMFGAKVSRKKSGKQIVLGEKDGYIKRVEDQAEEANRWKDQDHH